MPSWLSRKLKAWRRDTSGVAALEFAFAAMFLVVGALNAIDLGYYMYQRLQVENAAEAGAQEVWKVCPDQSKDLPAIEKCQPTNPTQTLNAAITTAIQTTSLGASVLLASGYPAEGYYCVNASNVLQLIASPPASEPANCSAVGNAGTAPSDYIQVGVTYNYAPLFGVSVMSAWGVKTITMVTWMRLG